MKKADWKYNVTGITKNDGTPVDPDDCIVFKRGDRAVPGMLDTYAAECEKYGATPEHIEGIMALKERVVRYQTYVESKIPDTKHGEIVEPPDEVADAGPDTPDDSRTEGFEGADDG